MVYGRMGQEGESIIKVKFQPVPVSTKRERSTDLADSGKKSVSSSGAVALPVFFGLADNRNEGDSLFCPVSKTFSTKRFPRITEHLFWGVSG